MFSIKRFALIIAVLAVLLPMNATRAEKPLLIFAAASMKDALEPVITDFQRDTGIEVNLSIAGTSKLARQLAAGAPADLFISADVEWIVWLKAQNLVIAESEKVIAHNRLALVAPATSTVPIDQDIAKTILAWRDGGKARMAVADPEHVPAGRYARAALKAIESQIGLYDDLAKRFAIAGNVRLASLLVARGEVPLGIVYRSDALTDKRIKLLGLFDDKSHPDILYPAVRVMGGDERAQRLLDYLGTPTARKHFMAAGLIVTEEGS